MAVINTENSLLLVIDVQERFMPLMFEREKFPCAIERIIKVAKILNIPLLWTEQAPEKLGGTTAVIHDLLITHTKPLAKKTFSCWGCPEFAQALRASGRQHVIIVGVETHVCVFQTARDLHQQGYQVQVVADATCARSEVNKETILSRLRHEGITVTTAETVICELLKTGDHPQFREVMAHIK